MAKKIRIVGGVASKSAGHSTRATEKYQRAARIATQVKKTARTSGRPA